MSVVCCRVKYGGLPGLDLHVTKAVTGHTDTLTIPNVTLHHTGVYACVAYNLLGAELIHSSQAKVQVRGMILFYFYFFS